VVASTKVGLVTTALTHLVGVKSKGEFTMGLVRGMGSNLRQADREEFVRIVFTATGERLVSSVFSIVVIERGCRVIFHQSFSYCTGRAQNSF
jgi:hypothetical protein